MEQKDKPLTTVIIPYVKGKSEQTQKINSKFNIRTLFKSSNTLRILVTNVNPSNETPKRIVYIVLRVSPIKTPTKEHIHNFKLKIVTNQNWLNKPFQKTIP